MTECLTHTHTHTQHHSKVENGKNGFSFVLLSFFFYIENIVLKALRIQLMLVKIFVNL